MDITKYYLSLDKISELKSEGEKKIIHEYYKDMLYAIQDGRNILATSIFNTLKNGGYLINIRDEKIDKVLS
jgi:hypothetical protein